MSYVLFAPGITMGPFFEYSDYINFIELKASYEDMPRGLSNGWASIGPALHSFVYGMVYLGIYLGGVVGYGFDP